VACGQAGWSRKRILESYGVEDRRRDEHCLDMVWLCVEDCVSDWSGRAEWSMTIFVRAKLQDIGFKVFYGIFCWKMQRRLHANDIDHHFIARTHFSGFT
jgi:hypothetical protein